MPLTLHQVSGYVERGLDDDLARWFPDGPKVEFDEPVRSVEPFLARVPQDAAAALASFDRRVRSEP